MGAANSKDKTIGSFPPVESSSSRIASIVAPPSSDLSFFSAASSSLLLSASHPSYTQCDNTSAPPPPPLPGGGSNSSPPPPPPNSLDGEADDNDDSIANAAAMASSYSNPGPFEHAAMDCKRLVMLDTYDGFRCDINKQLTPYMAVVHSFWLGTSMIPDGRTRTYSWLTQVADSDSLFMARVDPGRQSIDGRIHKAILGGLGMFKLQIGVSPEGQSDQTLAEIDVGAQTWTANVKYGSMGGGLVFGCNFYQAITPAFSMGGEGMYISANQNMVSNYLLKYTMPAKGGEDDEDSSSNSLVIKPKPLRPSGDVIPSSTFCASFNAAQATLCLNYKRIVTPNRVTLGAELECNPFNLDSQVVLGAEFKWMRSKLQVSVDGSAKMKSVLETKMGKEPGQPSLTFSAELDHLNDAMKFGYGLTIDG
jgi:mitochondrial import receptor subunit TOM40